MFVIFIKFEERTICLYNKLQKAYLRKTYFDYGLEMTCM